MKVDGMSWNLKTVTWKRKLACKNHINTIIRPGVEGRARIQKSNQGTITETSPTVCLFFLNACSLYALTFPNFLAQMIHQPQKHLMGHIYHLYLFIRFLMQEIAFFTARPFLQEHDFYISVKGRSCMMKYSITRKQVIWRLCHSQLSCYP